MISMCFKSCLFESLCVPLITICRKRPPNSHFLDYLSSYKQLATVPRQMCHNYGEKEPRLRRRYPAWTFQLSHKPEWVQCSTVNLSYLWFSLFFPFAPSTVVIYHEVTSFMTSPLSTPDISAPQVFEHRFDCIFHHLAATATGPLRKYSNPRRLQQPLPHINVWQHSW